LIIAQLGDKLNLINIVRNYIRRGSMSDRPKLTEDDLMEMLREVVDPDLQLPIADLGLIYRAEAFDDHVEVDITLTSPACPVGDLIVEDCRHSIKSQTDYEDVRVEIVWNPPWNKDLMSDELKLTLGIPI
jgi:metal-sulfur cluster biosynthetic enzyme